MDFLVLARVLRVFHLPGRVSIFPPPGSPRCLAAGSTALHLAPAGDPARDPRGTRPTWQRILGGTERRPFEVVLERTCSRPRRPPRLSPGPAERRKPRARPCHPAKLRRAWSRPRKSRQHRGPDRANQRSKRAKAYPSHLAIKFAFPPSLSPSAFLFHFSFHPLPFPFPTNGFTRERRIRPNGHQHGRRFAAKPSPSEPRRRRPFVRHGPEHMKAFEEAAGTSKKGP